MTDWIDCSQALFNGLVTWPGDPPVEIRTMRSQTEGDHTTASHLSLSAHVGTHIDAPRHLLRDRRPVDALPLDALCGSARVIDAAGDGPIRVDEFEELLSDGIQRALFRTSAAGPMPEGRFNPAFRGLTPDAAGLLVERGVRLVGMDGPSVDPYDSDDLPAHRRLLGADIVVIEGLDLSRAMPGDYEMIALPLRISDGDGAPGRVILRLLQ